ncbi:MAG: alpha/beta fold hydrolase [Planctomycetota bacterium]
MRRTVAYALLLGGALISCGQQDEADSMSALAGGEGYFEGHGGLRLYHRIIEGPGEPVVVVHGGPGCDSGYLVPDLEPLARTRTLVFYDQRGGGRSDLPDDEGLLSIDRHVADLEMLRRHLALERMTLLAHSFGPLLAAFYAIEHPERVERMIFIGPLPPRRADVWERFRKKVDAVLAPEESARMEQAWRDLVEGPDPTDACRRFWEIGLKPRFADADKIHLLRGDLCVAPPTALRYGMVSTNPATLSSLGDWDLGEALRGVTAPTLIIHGEAEAIPMDLVEEWETALPDARLLRVPDAAHFPYVERPDLVWPAIEQFLREN